MSGIEWNGGSLRVTDDTNLLDESIVLKYFSRFHDANDGRLQVEFAILIDGTHRVFHLLWCFALQCGRYFEFCAFIRIV